MTLLSKNVDQRLQHLAARQPGETARTWLVAALAMCIDKLYNIGIYVADSTSPLGALSGGAVGRRCRAASA